MDGALVNPVPVSVCRALGDGIQGADDLDNWNQVEQVKTIQASCEDRPPPRGRGVPQDPPPSLPREGFSHTLRLSPMAAKKIEPCLILFFLGPFFLSPGSPPPGYHRPFFGGVSDPPPSCLPLPRGFQRSLSEYRVFYG